jgi:hypothetical protein
VLPNPLTINIDLYPQSTGESLIENRQDYLATNATPSKKNTDTNQPTETKPTRKKHRRRPRKQAQSKQRSAIDELPHLEEQSDDESEEEDDDDDDDNTKIY